MSKQLKSMAMAWLVERLLLDTRGIRLSTLREESNRSPRSMRAWVQQLRDEYPGLRDSRGHSLVEVTGDGDARRIRLRRDASPVGVDVLTDLATELAATLLERLDGAGLGRAGADLRRMHADRMPMAARSRFADPRKAIVYHPGAPDYWGRNRALAALARAVSELHRVDVSTTWSPKALRLEPLSLVYGAGRICLVARAPFESPYAIDLDDISHVVVTDEVFEYPRRGEYDPVAIIDELGWPEPGSHLVLASSAGCAT